MRITEPLPYGLVPVRRAVDRRSPTLRVTGNGTEASPFVVRVAAGRGTDTIGAREFTLPMRVRTYGGVDVYFMFNLTLGQATVRNFHRTYAEIMRQIESQMRIAVSDPNLSYTIPQEEDAMLISIRSRFQDNQEIIQYLDSH
jgi:hypothetical protein